MLIAAYDPATNPINQNEWAFGVLECIHIASLAMSIGSIALVDLRLLGLGMRRQTAAELAKHTMPWTMVGLFLAIMSGMLLFTTDPLRYYYNESFQFKMICLMVAIVYHYTIHQKTVSSQAPPAVAAKLVAVISLGLWVSIVFGGLFYAFT